MVRVSNLCFGYDKNTIVLNNVSFSADTGAILGIYGRSGSGKNPSPLPESPRRI